jgi:hypothetical protein
MPRASRIARCPIGHGVLRQGKAAMAAERLTGALLDRLTHHVHILD